MTQQSLYSKKSSRPFGFESMFIARLHSESLLSERPGFDSRPAQTLRVYNFAQLWSIGSKITFFGRSDLFLLAKERKIDFEHF